jgi:hypothetical protein
VKDIPKMRGWMQLSHHPMLLILRMLLPGVLLIVHFNLFFKFSQITKCLGLSIDFDEKQAACALDKLRHYGLQFFFYIKLYNLLVDMTFGNCNTPRSFNY